ncbi:MAG: hypothetical protein ACFCVD_21500 [Nodosilinea sp.]
MVSSVANALPRWPLVGEMPLAPAAALQSMVCQLPPLAPPAGLGQVPALAEALRPLIQLMMALRSPIGGCPPDLALTPENLAPYISEEVGEVLAALDQLQDGWTAPAPSAIFSIPALGPSLLWMLASSSYEVMHLIEGGRAYVHLSQGEHPLDIVRLVPVLVLTTAEVSYALDLVTQTDPIPSDYLPEAASIGLADHDFDRQLWACGDLLGQITTQIGQTQPGLTRLLGEGCAARVLRPFQPWQWGTLRLHLHLAQVGRRPSPPPRALASITAAAPGESQLHNAAQSPSSTFTLDDFAESLTTSSGTATEGILGDWLTFTDDTWIHLFLTSYAQQVMGQGLGYKLTQPPTAQTSRELTCVQMVYAATDLVQGTHGLFKQTFVHAPTLVADVWPRLRWCLAQSSERIMQLMGGLDTQVLPPGQNWQQGRLYLRPLLYLATTTGTWIIDLGSGRSLPAAPLALFPETVIEPTDQAWSPALTVAELAALVNQDLTCYAPAMAILRQGTDINLHRLETEEGCQSARLSLDWCFTLQTAL